VNAQMSAEMGSTGRWPSPDRSQRPLRYRRRGDRGLEPRRVGGVPGQALPDKLVPRVVRTHPGARRGRAQRTLDARGRKPRDRSPPATIIWPRLRTNRVDLQRQATSGDLLAGPRTSPGQLCGTLSRFSLVGRHHIFVQTVWTRYMAASAPATPSPAGALDGSTAATPALTVTTPHGGFPS